MSGGGLVVAADDAGGIMGLLESTLSSIAGLFGFGSAESDAAAGGDSLYLFGAIAIALVAAAGVVKLYPLMTPSTPPEPKKTPSKPPPLPKTPSSKRPSKSPPKKRGGYEKIDGKNYDRSILDLAKFFTDEKPKLGKEEAKKLWKLAKDGGNVTETERATLLYICDNFEITKDAASFLHDQVEVGAEAGDKGYLGEVKGRRRSQGSVVVDRDLWNKISKLGRDGKIDKNDAKQIWEEAMDAGVVTATEKKTIKKALDEFTFTAGARTYLEEQLA
jgi:hypothetical protein